MKILLFNWQDVKNPFSGGAEIHLHEIFKRIAEKSNDVTLYCSSFPGASPIENIDGINVIREGNRNIFNFYVPLKYQQKFIKENYDIIIDDINKIPFFTPIFVKKPLMAISHHFFGESIFRQAGIISGSYVYASEKLIDFVYKKTPFSVVSESTLNEFLSRGFTEENFKIIPNALDQNKYPLKVSEKTSYPTIVYFGRLKKYKSIDQLIKAFSILSKKIPDSQLQIIGSGDFRPELEKLSSDLNIKDKVKFFGYVSDEEKINLLSKAYCVVNTSVKEGWGITNIEANACGTPILSANVPGLRDSVSEGVSGLLYEYGNINELEKLLYQIVTDNDLRKKLSDGAVSWAKHFNWENSAEKMLNYCEEIIERYKLKKLKY